MTFPVSEEHSGPSAEVETETPSPVVAAFAPTLTTSDCPACDGSGLWRGIDGFVFVCQHCVFEMT